MAGFDRNRVALSGSGDACGAYCRMGNPRNRAFKQPIALVYRSTLDLLRDGPRLPLRLQSPDENLNHRHPHHGPDPRSPERLWLCSLQPSCVDRGHKEHKKLIHKPPQLDADREADGDEGGDEGG